MLKELEDYQNVIKNYNTCFEKEKDVSSVKENEIKGILEKALLNHEIVSIVYYEGTYHKYYVGYIKKVTDTVTFESKFKVLLSKIKDICIRSEF